MRFSRHLLPLVLVGAAACGPTYVVQSAPQPAPQRVTVPPPPRVDPLQVSIVRPDDGRVLVQTSRPAYLAVFEIVPGRGVAVVYPRPAQPRDLTVTGLTWVSLYWTMRYDYRYASSDTRYIYAVASDTPLRLDDSDYDRYHLERRLGSTFNGYSPNATVRAISREFVRAQPDEYWGEDMFTMALAPSRVIVTIRWARVYCPGGGYFEVREDIADRVWCPARNTGRGRPVTQAPDSVFASNGRRVPRRLDPTARTPIFRVPAPTDVGQQQGHPQDPPPRNPGYPRTQPGNPQIPTNQPPQNQPPQNQPPATQPPQNQPPQNQPPATQPPQNQPPQTLPQDSATKGKDHDDNGRRAHGDPRNADPRGNGNGYGNGGREQPSTQPPATTPASQPTQQGQPQEQPGNNGRGNGNGNGNATANGNNANSGNDHGKNAKDAKPDHNDAPKGRFDAMMKKVQKQDDKKAASDSTKKP